ncbi:hypothetical protein POTOM_058599 [Populus tomentosa]|uniref:Uncharacterized protein n=1 Tax=Populus tomentosa TaxID=118781 RepID=A0A8X8C0V7_POPTO|nr:hypothetical protein POTOM_058599 [Populus tomentosa]
MPRILILLSHLMNKNRVPLPFSFFVVVLVQRKMISARSFHQNAKNQVKSISQAKKLSSPTSSTVVSSKVKENQKATQAEESLRRVMYLSCWGPY